MTIALCIINGIFLLIGGVYTVVSVYRFISYLIKRLVLYRTEALCISSKVCEVEQEQEIDGEKQTVIMSEYYDLLLQFNDKNNKQYKLKITSNKNFEVGSKIKILWNSKTEKMSFDDFAYFKNLILFVVGVTLIICFFAMN